MLHSWRVPGRFRLTIHDAIHELSKKVKEDGECETVQGGWDIGGFYLWKGLWVFRPGPQTPIPPH